MAIYSTRGESVEPSCRETGHPSTPLLPKSSPFALG